MLLAPQEDSGLPGRQSIRPQYKTLTEKAKSFEGARECNRTEDHLEIELVYMYISIFWLIERKCLCVGALQCREEVGNDTYIPLIVDQFSKILNKMYN